MSYHRRLALGLDFGTESVRALLVDLEGNERGSAAVRYRRGQITQQLPGSAEPLPAQFALQDPQDWLDASARAVRRALEGAGLDSGGDVISIGVDFTSCTMLPALSDGTPLCRTREWAGHKFAWPKLWKHHGAQRQTDRINEVARRRREPWLARYGGTVGLEWFFPKILETLDEAPEVYQATDVWLEGGDWFVWQLVGGPAEQLPRSTCQAGYKAMWNAHEGYPSADFFAAVDRRLRHVVRDKMPGRLLAPGQMAGELSSAAARRMGLPAGIAVSAAVIDAHAGVPGAGVAEPDTLVMVLGTSSCHMLNSRTEQLVPGVAGVVEGGILPGFFGYETGQAAVGDAFDWLRRLVGRRDFATLDREAAALPPGADGVRAVDWLNGCRTPLMNGDLAGAFSGLKLHHTAAHLYRALVEASACGVRWIVELLEEGGVPVRRLVATGGLPHHNPVLMQIYADVLARSVLVPPSEQGPALGAAILGVMAAGRKSSGFSSARAAIRAMAQPAAGAASRASAAGLASASGLASAEGREPRIVRPERRSVARYDEVYRDYRALAGWLSDS